MQETSNNALTFLYNLARQRFLTQGLHKSPLIVAIRRSLLRWGVDSLHPFSYLR